MIQSKSQENYSLLFHVLLTLIVIALRSYCITAEGKDNVLRYLPESIKEGILKDLGYAYTSKQT